MSTRCNGGAARTTIRTLLASAVLGACSGSTPAPEPLRGATEAEEEPPHPDPDEACGLLRPDTSNPMLGELPRGVVPLAGPALDGTTVDLGTLYGKVVLVSFQASWDSLTAQEQPTFNALADTIGDRLVILRVASEESVEAARAVTPADARYVTVLDLADPSCSPLGPITRSWGVTAVPESFLIDASGNVRYYFVNKRDWSTREAIDCVRALVRDGRTSPITSKEVALAHPGCSDPHSSPPPAPRPATPVSTKADPAQTISGTIHLPPTAKVGTAVFVFVKRVHKGKPVGIALAVDRLTYTGGALPFVLDNTMALDGDTRISGRVIVYARYDQDADAMSKVPGDLTGEVQLKVPARNVQLVVDQPVVP